MITRRLRLFTILTTSLVAIAIPKSIVNACGFSFGHGIFRFWLLQPDLTNKGDITPFFFASGYLYKDDINAATRPHVAINTDEWYREIDKKASKADIDSILNNTEPGYFFAAHNKMAEKNSFLRYLVRPENKELHQYLVICKKLEYPLASPDPWGENAASDLYIRLIQETEALNKTTKSSFIKMRSAYQLMRMYYRVDRERKADSIYNAVFELSKTTSWIKSAAIFQKARRASGTEDDYLLSKVFDRGNYNRTTCLVEFDSQNLNAILHHAKNEHERTVLYAMKVFNYRGKALNDLQRIYQAEPNYRDFSFLLLREINKIEDMLVTSKVTDFGPATYEWARWDNNPEQATVYIEDKRYARSVYDFIIKVINENKNKEGHLLHLYVSHLAMLLGNYDASLQNLEAAKSANLPANVQMQIRVNTLLLNLHMDKLPLADIENELLSIVKIPDSRSGVYDFGIMKDQLILYCGRKFIDKGYKAKGLMLLSKTKRAIGELPTWDFKSANHKIEELATPKEYDEIITTIRKKNKTPFESFVAGGYVQLPQDWDYPEGGKAWNIDELLDGKSRWQIRHNQLQGALATLNKISDSYWKKEPYTHYITGDPFIVNINHPWRVFEGEKRYSKKQVVAEMLRLQELAKKDPSQAPACYYKLGCAWFNMSYHGKNWLMMRRYWSWGDTYSASSKKSVDNDNYFGCIRAQEYFLKAMNSTKDKKLASLSCLMAGECNDNYREYLFMQLPYDSNKSFESIANPYLKTLKNKKMDAYYDEVVNECPTYLSFIQAYNK